MARSVWMRWLLGMPDDLAWRAERMSTRPDLGGASRARLVGLSIGVMVAVGLVLLVAAINTARYEEGTQLSGVAAVVLLLLATAMAVLGIVVTVRGLRVMSARPAEGAILVLGGSLVAGLAWYWLWLPVVIAIAVSIYGLWRAMGIGDASSKGRRRVRPDVRRERH